MQLSRRSKLPNESANENPIPQSGSRDFKDFVICENFIFRPRDVIGAYGAPESGLDDEPEAPEPKVMTEVFFDKFHIPVLDPQRKLFGFLKDFMEPEELP